MRLKLATPNMFWNAKTGERNLVLAHALEKEMLLFTSPDLKTWTIEGSFGKSLGAQEGAISPVVMSYCADFFGGIAAAVVVMTLGVIYLLFFTFIIKRVEETKEEKSHPTNWYPWAIGSTVTGFLASVIGGVFVLIAMKKLSRQIFITHKEISEKVMLKTLRQ